MRLLIIGNTISFVAACFTAASSLARTKKNIYLLQCVQCFLLAVANLFFRSYAGITTLLLCSLRNVLIACERFPMKLCIPYLNVIAIAGILSNNRGLLGLLPVITTVVYSYVACIAEKEKAIKLNILFNLLLWTVYEFYIHDFASFAADGICLLVTVGSLVQISRKK